MFRNKRSRPKHSHGRRLAFLERLEDRRVMAVAQDDGLVIVQDSAAAEIRVMNNDFHKPTEITPDMTYSLWSPHHLRVDGTVELDTEPTHGTATLSEDKKFFHYTPAPGFVGVDQFRYNLVEADGQISSANVYINVGRAVVAVDDWFRVDTGSEPIELDVVANDRAGVGYNLLTSARITEVSAAENGTVGIAEGGNKLTFKPADGFSGVVEFTYTVQDEAGHDAQGVTRVRVAPAGAANSSEWLEWREHELLQAALDINGGVFGTSSYRNLWPVQPLLLFGGGLPGASVMNFALQDASTNVVQTTNTQVDGVDEGDIIKADGDYLYVLSNRIDDNNEYQQLIIVDTRDPLQPFVVSRIDFDGTVLAEIIADDRLMVISRNGTKREDLLIDHPFSEHFVVTTFDVSNRAAPEIVYEMAIEGSFEELRSNGEMAYLVTQQHELIRRLPNAKAECVSDQLCFFETVDAYVARAKGIIAGLITTDGTPRYVMLAGDEETRGEVSEAPPISLVTNAHPYLTFSTVMSFALTGEEVGHRDSVTIWGHSTETVYVSQESIYLASAIQWGAVGKSNLYKFDLSADGDLGFAASGQITGHIPNQFAMDEHEGFLRVLTRDNYATTTKLFVLEQQGDDLEAVGKIDAIAPGEQMYSSRFDGDRGFVVTFRTVDPLFALDLSNPRDPKIQGELKIPGYSQYLQILSDDLVLGIGRNANESTGLYEEIQVSLFDVSDMAAPKLLQKYSFEGGRDTWSPIMLNPRELGDHHAVNYYADHQVLAIPFYTGPGVWWSGLRPENVTNASFRLLKVDPSNGIEAIGEIGFDEDFNATAARTVLINNSLYAISPDEIKVVNINDPSEVQANLYIGRGATDDQAEMQTNSSVVIDVTANDDLSSDAKQITSLGEAERGGTVTLGSDGRTIHYSPRPGFVGTDRFNYLVQSEDGSRAQATVKIDVHRNWHNVDNAYDADGDGVISPMDVLVQINFINQHGTGSLREIERTIGEAEGVTVEDAICPDVDNDQHISPFDVLALINFLNNQGSGGEGEAEDDRNEYVNAIDAAFADPLDLFA